jgi:hypothetical protein
MAQDNSTAQDEYGFLSVAQNITNFGIFENIMSHIKNLSSLGPRTTGYEGCDKAAEYIRSKFEEYGLKPLEGTENYFQTYDLTAPVDHNTTIEVLYPNGTQIEIAGYALWPNDVQACTTPPDGIEGPLIDVKEGFLSDFNGKEVNGSIVLMDFNSGDNWLNAAKFGATAAIFIEPYDTNRIEAEKKFTTTPLYFPRIYVNRTYGEALRRALSQSAATEKLTVRIKSDMRYETVQAKNVISVIEGENTNEAIIFSSYYDSWSVVPKLNPGADEASGVASLLELAHFFSTREKPLRNIVFAAFSGHWEALAGAREFVEEFVETEPVVNGSKKYWFLINLDFSSDSEFMTYLYTGDFYHINKGHVGMRFDPLIRSLLEIKYIPALDSLTKSKSWEYDFSGRSGGYGKLDLFGFAQFPTFVVMDSEPFAAAGGVGISFRTSSCYRLNWGHPFNTASKVNIQSLKHQVVFTFCIANALADEPSYGWTEWELISPKRVWTSMSQSEGAGVVTVYGDVVEYDASKGFYSNSNILQPGYQILVEAFLGWNTWYAITRFNPFTRIITTVNASGQYTIHALGCYYTLAQFAYERVNGPYDFLAYVINRTTGQIEYAPDLGQFGLAQYKFRDFYLKVHPQFVRTVVFETGSIVLYDLIDPGSAYPAARKDYHKYAAAPRTWLIPITIQINDFESHSPLTTYGVIYSVDTCESLAIIFVPPETPFEILIVYSWVGGRRLIGVLANMSASVPQGTGLIAKAGEYLPITFTPLRFAEDLYYLNRYRLDLLLSYNVNSTYAATWIKSAETELAVAHSALNERNYEKAYTAALGAWSFMGVTHESTRSTIDDTVRATIFFSAILIPFSFLAERLFVRAGGRKRIVAIIAIFSILLGTLVFLHPGFKIASGSFALLLSFAALILSIPVLAILFSDIFGFFKELRQKIIGLHFAEISRFGAITMAFSVGIGNMWRRKLRTTLVLVTVILITVSLISLTSVATIAIPRTQVSERTTQGPRVRPAFYNGILIKHQGGQYDISPGLTSIMETLIEEEVPISTIKLNERCWEFPAPSVESSEHQTKTFFEVRSSNKSFNRIEAIEGLSPNEPLFTPINESLIEGEWFTEDDFQSCIISQYVQTILGVEVFDKISVWGLNLTIKGIIDGPTADEIRDVDGRGIAPVMSVAAGQPPTEVPFDRVIIVPYKFAKSILAAPLSSLSFEIPVETAEKVALKLVFGGAGFYEIYVSSEDQVSLYRSTGGLVVKGWQFMPIPIILGALTVLNTLVASIYERRKDISTYSSVGLAPLHVAGMFFSECVVFAVIGSILGYILGTGVLIVLINTQALPPGFVPNFSSSYVIIAVLVSMAATMGASLLPLYMVARQVTPSLERKWKIPTKPMGNEWAIPLPFETEEEEVIGTLAFIKEFLETHAVERAETFVTREISYREEVDERGRPVKALTATIVLPPYDASIVQSASINARWSEETQRYAFELYSKQLSGLQRGWIKSNRAFADEIRKQLLLWRGIPPENRRKYVQMAKKELKPV